MQCLLEDPLGLDLAVVRVGAVDTSLVQHRSGAGTVRSEQRTRFMAVHLGKAIRPPNIAGG